MREQPLNRYVPGTYLKDCDECSFTFLRSEMTKRYDEAIVCPRCMEDEPRDQTRRPVKSVKPFRRD